MLLLDHPITPSSLHYIYLSSLSLSLSASIPLCFQAEWLSGDGRVIPPLSTSTLDILYIRAYFVRVSRALRPIGEGPGSRAKVKERRGKRK